MYSALVAAVGADPFGDVVWLALEQEADLDLRWARHVEHLQTPFTISLSDGAERSFASHGTLDPVPVSDLIDTLPAAKACFISLDSDLPNWLALQRAAGASAFGDVGRDPTHGWSPSLTNCADAAVATTGRPVRRRWPRRCPAAEGTVNDITRCSSQPLKWCKAMVLERRTS